MADPVRLHQQPAPDRTQRQLDALGRLLQLEKRVRQTATPAAFGFHAVNDTLGLVRYRQAALWRCGARGDGEIVAVSGLAMLDRNAPFLVWLRRLAAAAARQDGAETQRPLAADTLPEPIAREWGEWLPGHLLWIPLAAPDGERLGALLLARDEPWKEADRHLLGHLAGTYGHAWAYLLRKSRRETLRRFMAHRNRIAAVVLLALFGLAWVPVRDSALAPAEVIARAPVVIRAPIDGVIEQVLVVPNQPVQEGQVLLRLDAVRLQAQLEVAERALAVAEAEYRQTAQRAVFDTESKAVLPVLQGRVEQHAAEVAYIRSLLDRVVIAAPRAGIAVFDDINDWIGKPVRTGERILLVADPAETELEIRLPVADAIALEEGTEVRLFLNIDPQRAVDARLTYAGYQAGPGPDGILAYRLKAAFAAGERGTPRIGLKGTAKIFGRETTLFAHVFRRPLAALRQRLGL